MIRARFYVNDEDPRPVVWPIKHPYWVTGHAAGNAVIVAYADDVEEIKTNWPDAELIESTEVDSYVFTDRFPVPSWFSVVPSGNKVIRSDVTIEFASNNDTGGEKLIFSSINSGSAIVSAIWDLVRISKTHGLFPELESEFKRACDHNFSED